MTRRAPGEIVGVSAINFSVAKEALIPEGELVATYLFFTLESEAAPLR